MLVKLDLPEIHRLPVVVALGVFDGVHIGHQKIIAQLANFSNPMYKVAITFDPHPKAVIGTPPKLLLPIEERIKALHTAGVDAVGVIKFDHQFAQLEPEEFLQQLTSKFNIKGLCVGKHWRFGRKGAGGELELTKFARSQKIEFIPCEELEQEQRVISSSWIRELLCQGDLAKATKLLGRNPQIFGKVSHGTKIAGKVLGTPTANVEDSQGIIPPNGVYAAWVNLEDGTKAMAAVNIGFSPTFAVGVHRIEAHLLNSQGNFYDQKIAVSLVAKIRNECTFKSPEELRKQIALDIKNIEEILSE